MEFGIRDGDFEGIELLRGVREVVGLRVAVDMIFVSFLRGNIARIEEFVLTARASDRWPSFCWSCSCSRAAELDLHLDLAGAGRGSPLAGGGRALLLFAGTTAVVV